MKNKKLLFAGLIVLGSSGLFVASCSDADEIAGGSRSETHFGAGKSSDANVTKKVPVAEDTVIVDVRTPQEFVGGHLEDAINIDVQNPNFETVISELDPDAEYLVYCRSGNRSGQAIQIMKQLGFSNVTNIGSVQEASAATGIPVVR